MATSQVTFYENSITFPSGFYIYTADFNGDGKPDLVTYSGAILLGNGDGSFTVGTPLSLPSGAIVIATGDFNNDGKADILVRNGNYVETYLGNGDGTFQSPASTYLGFTISAFAIGDVNGDGKLDLLANNSMLMVFLGKGDGTFSLSGQYTFANSSGPLVIGDFNGDGKLDAAAIYEDTTSDTIFVALGNGDGTFQSPKTTTFAVGECNFDNFLAGNFYGDRNLDLITVCSSNTAQSLTLSTFKGNGDGTFQAPANSMQVMGRVLALGDLNSDGNLDVVITDGSNPYIQVLLGTGNGGFSGGQEYYFEASSGGAGSNSIVADFNGDGKADVVVAGGAVLLGSGDGTLQTAPAILAGLGPEQAVTGDFNNDGVPDLAVVTGSPGTVNIELGDAKGNFTASSFPEPGISDGNTTMATGDFNGDGNLDLVFSSTGWSSSSLSYAWTITTLFGAGNGSFGSPITTTADTGNGFSSPTVLATGDFNGDHKLDIAAIVFEDSAGFVYILLGNGDGTFAAPQPFFAGFQPQSVQTGDFNGDGKLDVVVTSNAGIAVLFGNGNGTLQPAVFVSTAPTFGLTVADVNGDGKLDLITYGTVFLGNGDGTFTAVTSPNAGPGFVADFNGDGLPDLATTVTSGADTGAAVIVLGNGDGTFGNPTILGIPIVSHDGSFDVAAVADFNLDGRPDLAISTGAQLDILRSVGILLNTTGPPGPNFKVAASNLSPPTIAPGQSANSTLTLSPVSGFSGTVNLACAVTPSSTPAPACMVSPSSVQVSGSSAAASLSITTNASPATASGSYLATVTATSGSLTHPYTLAFIVEPSSTPDFSVSATSLSAGTLAPGASASSNLTISPADGFSGTVNLTCALSPSLTPAPTCSLSASSVQVTGGQGVTGQVTISTSASPATALGNYVATVTASSGALTHQAQVTFAVQAAPDFQATSTPLSPTNIAPGASATSTFTLTAENGFAGTVSLSCSVTPAVTEGPACTLNPSSLNVSGATGVTSNIRVSTTGPTTTGSNDRFGISPGVTLASILFVFVAIPRRRRRSTWPLALICFVAVLGPGCGGNSTGSKTSTPGTPAGTYTITVTSTSGSLTHPMQLSLTVQ